VLAVLEATGGYERAAVAALATAGLPLVVANPRQVRAATITTTTSRRALRPCPTVCCTPAYKCSRLTACSTGSMERE
jgi:hypothetical protein